MEDPLSTREVEVYKQRLLDLRSSLADEVEKIEVQTLEPSGESRLRPEDEASEESSLDDQLDGLAIEDALGYAVHRALERVNAGTYGICMTCKKPIPRERLDLLPYAVECVSCAEARGSSEPDPGVVPEEPALRSPNADRTQKQRGPRNDR